IKRYLTEQCFVRVRRYLQVFGRKVLQCERLLVLVQQMHCLLRIPPKTSQPYAMTEKHMNIEFSVMQYFAYLFALQHIPKHFEYERARQLLAFIVRYRNVYVIVMFRQRNRDTDD